MKVLIVGARKDYVAEYFYMNAFRKLGHDVILINEYDGVKNPLLSRIIHTRTGLFSFTLKRMEVNNNIIERVRKIDPDVILIFKGEFVSTPSIMKLSENFDTYLFYTDMYKYEPILRGRLHYFKVVFTAANKTDFYYNLGAKKVVTVPWSCDPDFHRKLNIERRYDVSFVGTAYPERRRIIRKIHKVHVFGDFWYGFGKFSHGPVWGEDFVKAISQSKINLNLQAKANLIADAPTQRTFEVSGCGGFQISNNMPSMKRYLPMVPTFRDISELKELISYYLENGEEREDIAEKSMKVCYESFKYTDAAKLIISSL